MKNTIKSRKGVTLTELVVVLAVVVIAAGMVVTFSSMMHGAQGISNERYEALQDVRTAEALIEGFILNNTQEGYYLEWIEVENIENGIVSYPSELSLNFCKSNDDDFSTTEDNDRRFVRLSNMGAFVMTGKEVIFFEHITSITFDMECLTPGADFYSTQTEKEKIITTYHPNTCDILYYCTITYKVADTTTYTYTFCVNPYVGEGVN